MYVDGGRGCHEHLEILAYYGGNFPDKGILK